MLAFDLNHSLLWRIFIAILELGVCSIIGTIIQNIISSMSKKAKDKGVLTFFASFVNIFFKVIGLIIALDQLGVSMNLIIGALSALGVGISLALKDNMASVASGLQILLTKPFKVGDYIKVGKHEGKVVSIEMTYTTLMTPGNQEIVVPNNSLITKAVTNFSSQLNRKIEIDFPCDVPDVDKYELILMKAAQTCPMVVHSPVPVVSIQALDPKGAVLHLECYTAHENYSKCYSDLMRRIHDIVMEPVNDSKTSGSGKEPEKQASASNSAG